MLTLYSRHDCPLCEEVELMLQALAIAYRFVDIDLDEKLRKKYHVLVPVLHNQHGHELRFPFSPEQIKKLAGDL